MSRATATGSLLPRDLDAAQAQRLIEAAGDIALLLDGDGVVLDVLAHDRELRKASRRDWRGKAWADTVTAESRDKVREMLAAALTDAPPVARQVNHPSKSGPDKPVLYAAVRVAGGTRSRAAVRVVAVGRDLRDTVALQRRLVEAQQTMERDYWRFREAETRYRTLFQSSAEAVLVVDGSTSRVVEANPAALTLLSGIGARAVAKPVGMVLASLFTAEAAEPLAGALAAARSVGKHERLVAKIAGSRHRVSIAIWSFRQDQASYLLVRLSPMPATPVTRTNGHAAAAPHFESRGEAGIEAAFVRGASDAVAFTDAGGRVVMVNRAFVRLAQLSSEEQARGEPLSRWLGRTGVELSVLLANVREGATAGLFVTELRGAMGLVAEVEIAASAIDKAGPAVFAFSIRDVGRRLSPADAADAVPVSPSVQQLTELVGRVPLKQIVAETSDLIERLSIETALDMTRDNRAMAAQLLGLSRQSLYVKLRRYDLGGPEGPGDGDD